MALEIPTVAVVAAAGAVIQVVPSWGNDCRRARLIRYAVVWQRLVAFGGVWWRLVAFGGVAAFPRCQIGVFRGYHSHGHVKHRPLPTQPRVLQCAADHAPGVRVGRRPAMLDRNLESTGLGLKPAAVWI